MIFNNDYCIEKPNFEDQLNIFNVKPILETTTELFMELKRPEFEEFSAANAKTEECSPQHSCESTYNESYLRAYRQKDEDVKSTDGCSSENGDEDLLILDLKGKWREALNGDLDIFVSDLLKDENNENERVEVQKKQRKSKKQLQILRDHFRANPNPNFEFRKKIAVETGLNDKQVRKWFGTEREKYYKKYQKLEESQSLKSSSQNKRAKYVE